MLLVDKNEFLKFYDKLYELEKDEVFFLCLSARNKYLTDEERKEFSLGRTEMFGREFVYEKSIDKFELILKKLDLTLEYRTTSNGSRIPDKAMVVYFNLNPTSTIKAYQAFQEEMNKELFLLLNNIRSNNQTEMNYDRFRKSQSILKTQFQKYPSRKVFLDIDCDTKDTSVVCGICSFLKKYNVDYFVIQSQGGYHVIIKKDTMPKDKLFGKALFQDIIPTANDCVCSGGGEVIINKNEMIPLPGTLQAGNHLVKIIDKFQEVK
jgi:hypothetical protein